MIELPCFFVFRALAQCDTTTQPVSCNWASGEVMMSLVVPGFAVGALTGAPFVPLALAVPED